MTNISINKLHEFRDHPYQVLDNEEMNSLIESVQQQGIMTPLIVRPLENTADEYEIISGHRRFRAAQKAGLTDVPAFIRPVSRDDCTTLLRQLRKNKRIAETIIEDEPKIKENIRIETQARNEAFGLNKKQKQKSKQRSYER